MWKQFIITFIRDIMLNRSVVPHSDMWKAQKAQEGNLIQMEITHKSFQFVYPQSPMWLTIYIASLFIHWQGQCYLHSNTHLEMYWTEHRPDLFWNKLHLGWRNILWCKKLKTVRWTVRRTVMEQTKHLLMCKSTKN